MSLRPFWTYFGGKWRIAPRYPQPLFDTIVEPFAGAAGYALRYPHKQVILVEKSPLISSIWKYLIGASSHDINCLPRLPASGLLEDATWPNQESRNLAGFWITRGASYPNRQASAWMRDSRYVRWSWGDHSIGRIARQVEAIKHWRVIEGDYTKSPDIEATWFIDPPYIKAGHRYPHGSKGIDYDSLGSWCCSRKGQAIVCEQEGATWLPFQEFYKPKANESVNGGKISAEVIWTSQL